MFHQTVFWIMLPLLVAPLLVWGSVWAFIVKASIPSLLRKKTFASNNRYPPSPKAHCMDGLPLQKLWCLQSAPPLLPPPAHRHTHTHFPCSFCSSQRCSTASVFVLREPAAPWKPFLPPSLPPSLSSQPFSRILFDHSCLSGMSEWVCATEEGDKEENGDHKEKERERTGTLLITSMQATADVTKKESSWSSWKGQGTDVFTVIYSSIVCVLWLWEMDCLHVD